MSWFGSNAQNISWFRDEMKNGRLLIKPPYQRKAIWKLEQKCALIESILMDMPIPEIFMQTIVDAEGNTTHAIVDGQQRIRTILHFMGVDPTESESEFQNFKLEKLSDESPFYGKELSDLSAIERTRFFGYKFTIRTLDSVDDAKIRSVFQRLNEFQSPMLPQELRNAKFSGPFLKLANKLADLPYWLDKKIIKSDDVRRMLDIEFMSEILFGMILGPQSGNKETINDLYATYDSYEEEFPEETKYESIFNETLDIIKICLPDISKTRWSNKTDFYSLFLTLSNQIENNKTVRDIASFREKLHLLDRKISDIQKRKDESEFYSDLPITTYVNNVSRGSSDKSRRSARNVTLSIILDQEFIDKSPEM